MWLYRVMSMSKDESCGVFYDATASLQHAIHTAKIIQRREPSCDVKVEAESWPRLPRWKYHFHRITGTHEGFGVNFMERYGLMIEDIKTVWPKDVSEKAA